MLNDASAKHARKLGIEFDSHVIEEACHGCVWALLENIKVMVNDIRIAESSGTPEDCVDSVKKMISGLESSQLALFVLMAGVKAIELGELLREEGIFEDDGYCPCSYKLVRGKGNRCRA